MSFMVIGSVKTLGRFVKRVLLLSVKGTAECGAIRLVCCL